MLQRPEHLQGDETDPLRVPLPEMGREISYDWRLLGVVRMVLSQKAFVYKKEEDAERPGI